MPCTCSGGPSVTAEIQEAVVGGYMAVKKCSECGIQLDKKLLGSSSKYTEWSEEQILEQFN